LFLFVRDGIRYSMVVPFFAPEHYRASAVLARKSGYCVQKAVLLAALARAAGIPARLVFVDIRNHRAPERVIEMMGTNLFTYHSYTELYLGGRWVAATPAFDRITCEQQGYPLVVFDGQHDAIFPPVDDQGRPFVEYVHTHGTYPDVPLEELLRAWERAYGKQRVTAWKKAFVEGLVPGL
jgi:transglutaminase-like putative cysteine protease